MGETRKLAAILIADVVGYSRLAAADEDRTLARLRGLRSDLIDPAVAAHHGRIVKRTGDGSIIEFRSVKSSAMRSIASLTSPRCWTSLVPDCIAHDDRTDFLSPGSPLRRDAPIEAKRVGAHAIARPTDGRPSDALWHRCGGDCACQVQGEPLRGIATHERLPPRPHWARSRLQSSPVFSDKSSVPPGNPSGLAATAVPIAHAGAGGRLGLTRLR